MNDTNLRTALCELGAVAPPPDLAGSALARARRGRRRTVAGAVAGVAVLAAVAVAVPALMLGPPAAETGAGAARVVVTGFLSYNPTRIGDHGEKRVYDPSSGRYVTPSWDVAVPSPDGRQVAVSAAYPGGTKVGIVSAERVLDLTAVRWVAGGAAREFNAGRPAVWSPDGSRVLFGDTTTSGQQGATVRDEWTVVVVDARTLAWHAVTMVYLDAPAVTFSGPVVFGPGGRGFAVAPSDGPIVLFDEQGRQTRTIRTGTATLPDRPFSPDGRLVAVRAGDPSRPGVDGSTRVLDAATGAEVGRADGDVIGWVDSGRYAVWDGRAVRVVELGSGRVLVSKDAPVAAPRVLAAVWLAPLDGRAPPGATVL
jgi:hypothetical protein